MVNAKRVVQKLPCLLTDGATTRRKNFNMFFRYRWRLQQLKKRNPQRFQQLTSELLGVLERIDRELASM